MKTPNNISNSKNNNKQEQYNDMSLNLNTITVTSNPNYPDSFYINSQPKINKGKKVISQNKNNDNKVYKMDILQNQKQTPKNPNSNLNSKLSPGNYIKPLYYLLNNQIKAINKQFLGYRDGRNYLYPFPSSRNEYNIKYNSNKNEEKKENNSKLKSPKNKNKKNKNNYKDEKNFRSNKNKSKNKSKTKSKNKTKNKNDLNDLNNEKAILIQANFMGYLARKKIYNSLSPYCKFRQDLDILEKITKFKNIFFNKLKQLKEEYEKNKNNINGNENENENEKENEKQEKKEKENSTNNEEGKDTGKIKNNDIDNSINNNEKKIDIEILKNKIDKLKNQYLKETIPNEQKNKSNLNENNKKKKDREARSQKKNSSKHTVSNNRSIKNIHKLNKIKANDNSNIAELNTKDRRYKNLHNYYNIFTPSNNRRTKLIAWVVSM